MTSDRPYRKGMPAEVAFARDRERAGKQFDPSFAAAFLEIKDGIIKAMSHRGAVPLSTSELITV